jgi:hypothetical protein
MIKTVSCSRSVRIFEYGASLLAEWKTGKPGKKLVSGKHEKKPAISYSLGSL